MNRIMVFVKAPVPGRVKTRLCPPLSPAQAAALYVAFVEDTLEAAGRVARAQVDVFYAPSAEFPDLGWLESAIAPPFFAQRGGDLGTRLDYAFQDTFSRGTGKAVAIGSDTPQLSPAAIDRAFSSLDEADVVLGPAADGGYYLIGLKESNGPLFDRISWSTAAVRRQTLERARGLGLRVAMLPMSFDVDTASDLKRLDRHLAANGAGTSRRTRLVLGSLSSRQAL